VGVYPDSAKHDPHGNVVHADNVGLSVKATSNVALTASTEPPPVTPPPVVPPVTPPPPVVPPAPPVPDLRAVLLDIRNLIDKALG
jgi:hypothetical protein